MRTLPYGRSAVLAEVGTAAEVRGLVRLLGDRPAPGQTEVVPGARTVLVRLDGDPAEAAAYLERLDVPALAADGPTVRLPVVYDGADLEEVADRLGVSTSAVVERHAGAVWSVEFCGFAPGFGYLTADGDPPRVPRRDDPRSRIPSGSVGLAGPYSGVYPRSSPGGWQLVGRTDAVLWDVSRDPPALLAPGYRVRFEPVDALTGRPDEPVASTVEVEGAALRVVDPGPSCTIQDGGRPGHAALGVPVSGAADRDGAAQANGRVGNPPDAAVLEVTLGRGRFAARGDLRIACGGAVPGLVLVSPSGDRHEVDPGTAFDLPDGWQLRLTGTRRGLRTYLAVRGGIGVPAVLGSRSTDTLSGLGPAPCARDDLLPVGVAPSDTEGAASRADGPVDGGAALRVRPGPRADWLAPDPVEALEQLVRGRWTVGPRSDRVAVRLEGAPLSRLVDDELPSEGLLPGAVQLPPNGLPVVFLADAPTTGGYPVVAVVDERDLGLAAQLRPGHPLRFTPAS